MSQNSLLDKGIKLEITNKISGRTLSFGGLAIQIYIPIGVSLGHSFGDCFELIHKMIQHVKSLVSQGNL